MTQKLEPAPGMAFESSKTYTHAQGLSCTFRQWRATHSHCRFLHGYALQVTIVFRSKELDDRNWVMDFGGLKHLKEWLVETFDHKTLIAEDDPALNHFVHMSKDYKDQGGRLIDLTIVEHVGCEAFAKLIFEQAEALTQVDGERLQVQSVEVREHEGNAATYRRL